jgi:hypothetical protein
MASVGDSRYNADAPPRLVGYAMEVKAKIDANYNKNFDGQKIREKELPVLPPNVSRQTFNTAISELRQKIGAENVELNDNVSVLLAQVDLVASGRWVVSQAPQNARHFPNDRTRRLPLLGYGESKRYR